jgi:anti-sigma B factor antagonist
VTSPAVPVPPKPSTPGTARVPDEDPTSLTVDVDEHGDTCVVRVHGEIDILTVAQLRTALRDRLMAGPGTVVVDLRGVSFVACTGLGLLADTRRRARQQGTRLQIVAGTTVERTAAILDLTTALGLAEPA